MLAELMVKNLGIIEDVDWRLNKGLNIITGETGSGKSLIIDAVELLLNGTPTSDVIR
jgi:DNA repair protein RecN (Recombination protein N)